VGGEGRDGGLAREWAVRGVQGGGGRELSGREGTAGVGVFGVVGGAAGGGGRLGGAVLGRERAGACMI